jgi:hypothetical protein
MTSKIRMRIREPTVGSVAVESNSAPVESTSAPVESTSAPTAEIEEIFPIDVSAPRVARPAPVGNARVERILQEMRAKPVAPKKEESGSSWWIYGAVGLAGVVGLSLLGGNSAGSASHAQGGSV